LLARHFLSATSLHALPHHARSLKKTPCISFHTLIFYTNRGTSQDIYAADLRFPAAGRSGSPSPLFSGGSSDYDPVFGVAGMTTRSLGSGVSIQMPNTVVYFKSNAIDGYGDRQR
jgi:hypothetical protein